MLTPLYMVETPLSQRNPFLNIIIINRYLIFFIAQSLRLSCLLVFLLKALSFAVLLVSGVSGRLGLRLCGSCFSLEL